jgi:hypothetical protein
MSLLTTSWAKYAVRGRSWLFLSCFELFIFCCVVMMHVMMIEFDGIDLTNRRPPNCRPKRVVLEQQTIDSVV